MRCLAHSNTSKALRHNNVHRSWTTYLSCCGMRQEAVAPQPAFSKSSLTASPSRNHHSNCIPVPQPSHPKGPSSIAFNISSSCSNFAYADTSSIALLPFQHTMPCNPFIRQRCLRDPRVANFPLAAPIKISNLEAAIG